MQEQHGRSPHTASELSHSPALRGRQPKFVAPIGSLVAPPPYLFEDVTCYSFGVPSYGNALQQLCDRYLNEPQGIRPGDSSAQRWTPFKQYLNIRVLTYGKMTAQTAVGSSSLAAEPQIVQGSTSQSELAFVMNVEHPRYGLALFSPFIVVDNPISMVIGREVFGFPKHLGTFEFKPNVQNPESVTVSTWVLPEDGKQVEQKEFLRINGIQREASFRLSSTVTPVWPFGLIDLEDADPFDFSPEEKRMLSEDPTHFYSLVKRHRAEQLKQFRASTDNNTADFQAGISGYYEWIRNHNSGSLDDGLELVLKKPEWKSLELIKMLGLRTDKPMTFKRGWQKFDFRLLAGELLNPQCR